jgi:hypothetical protein
VHSSGREQRYIRFLVLSSEPIFSFKDSKKAWLIAVVLSLGNAMNGQPDVKTGELYVADADVKTNVAYALPDDLAKSLQKKRDRGLARGAAEHYALPALSNFRSDGFREWCGGDAFVPRKSRPTMIPSQALTKGKKSPHLSPSMSAVGTKQTCSMR